MLSNIASINAKSEPTGATAAEPVLSIVIVSWNTRDLLLQVLASIESEMTASRALGNIETFVVDNASTDETVAEIRQHFSWVQLIANTHNPGFAAANNQAIAQSKGQYVLLLNPDTELRPGALKALVDFLEDHPAAGAAGARLLNPDGTLQVSCYPQLTLPRELWRLFHLEKFLPRTFYRMEQWPVDRPREVDVLQGAALLVRRAVLAQVGLLDPAYFIYTEEVDLCYRIQQAGWQLFWVPTSQVVHYGGQSTRQAAAAMFLQLYRSKIQYFRKHHGRTAAQCYKLILAAAAGVRVACSPLAGLFQPSQQQRMGSVAANYRFLLRSLPKL